MSLRGEVGRLYNAHINSGGVVLTRHPIGAAGVPLVAGGVAWTLAAAGAGQVQVVALGLNPNGMWLCGAGLDTPSAGGMFVIWVGRGTIPAAVLCAQVQVDVQAFAGAAAGAVFVPVLATVFFPPVFIPAGVGIALDITSSNAIADTCNGHVVVATGL